MINKCDGCVMANCCEEFENAGCDTIRQYGAAIEEMVTDKVLSMVKEHLYDLDTTYIPLDMWNMGVDNMCNKIKKEMVENDMVRREAT